MTDEWIGIFLGVLLLTLTKSVECFRVLSPLEASRLDLSEDNVELLQFAARTGDNVTADLRQASQYVISQHGAFFTFDCSSILPSNPIPGVNNIMWERTLESRSEAESIGVGTGDRIRVEGPFNSLLRLWPTNIIQGGQAADGGDYVCFVCGVIEDSCPLENSRVTTLVLIGNGPPDLHNRTCRRFPTSYVCDIGQEVAIPHTVNQTTGARNLSISRLIIRAELTAPAVPTPTYTWTKDGVTVLRDANANTAVDIEPDFLDANLNNSLLFLINPLPLMVFYDRMVIDFTAYNATMLPEGVVIEDLRGFLRESVQGMWTCNISNVFGSVAATSTVFIDDDCGAFCQNCQGQSTCVYNQTTERCECVCPSGYIYSEQLSNCTDIDECASNETHNCDLGNQNCLNFDGGFNCSCRDGHIFNSVNQTCLDCGFQTDIQNGRVVVTVTSTGTLIASEVCEEGFQPDSEGEERICQLDSTSSTGVTTTGTLSCTRTMDESTECDIFCIIIIVVVLVVVLFLLILLIICICCCIARCGWHRYDVPPNVKKQRDLR